MVNTVYPTSVKGQKRNNDRVFVVRRQVPDIQNPPTESASIKPEVTLRNRWEHFCQTTGLPGFRYLVDLSLPKWIRGVWCLLILSFFAILLLVVTSLSIDVFSKQKVYSSMTVITNDTVAFPDIHICDRSFFSRKRLEEMGFNDTMRSYLIEAQSFLLESNLNRNNALDLLEKERLLSESLDELLTPYNGNLKTVLMRAALKCEEIIAGCVQLNQRFNASTCCAKYFNVEQQSLNAFGSCITTAGREPQKEIFAVNMRGITFLIKLNSDDREMVELVNRQRAVPDDERNGLILSVSHPSVFSYSALLSHAQYVLPGSSTMMGLSLTRSDIAAMKTSSLAPYTCAFESELPELVRGFPLYSKANCELSAIQRVYNDRYGCNILSVPSVDESLPYCLPVHLAVNTKSKDDDGINLDDQIKDRQNRNYHLILTNLKYVVEYHLKNMSFDDQECLKDCISTTYIVETTRAQMVLSPLSLKEYGIQPDEVGRVASVHLYLTSLSYVNIVQEPEQLLSWLGNVGANMGLYMGASLIGIVELLIFLSRYVLASAFNRHQ